MHHAWRALVVHVANAVLVSEPITVGDRVPCHAYSMAVAVASGAGIP